MSGALPRALRNRLSELILRALHDEAAREVLRELAGAAREPSSAPPEAVPGSGAAAVPSLDRAGAPGGPSERGEGAVLFPASASRHDEALAERARRAWTVMAARPLAPRDGTLAQALDEAADVFAAGLYFEVHEHLEPHWLLARGPARGALQGLIQVAAGFHHLAGGNVTGARALLREGVTRLRGAVLLGMNLDEFAAAVDGCRADLDVASPGVILDATLIPPFPRPSRS